MTESIDFCENTPSELWDTVVAMVDEKRAPSRRDEDEVYRRGFNFLKRWRTSTKVDRWAMKRDYPTLFSAFVLYANPQSEKWMIEAGLLTETPVEKIAEYVGQAVEVIKDYALFFFNVRSRLRSRGYILNQIMMPAFARGMHQRDYDMLFKTMAYCMGWDVFTEFLDKRSMSAQTRSKLSDGFKDNLIKLGYIATQRIEVNNFNATMVIELCLKLAEMERATGLGASNDEAMVLMQSLLSQCKLAIMPTDAKFMEFDEPRAYTMLTGAATEGYRAQEKPELTGSTNG